MIKLLFFAILPPPPPPKIVILLTFSDFYVILVFPRQKYEISTSREFVNCEAWYVWHTIFLVDTYTVHW